MPGGVVISMASTEDSPSRLEAATVIAHGPNAGEPTVPIMGPSLPPATTASTPAFVAAISATSSGALIWRRVPPTE